MKAIPFKIDMTIHVKDVITGFNGHITGRAQYVTGCNTYQVQPKCKKGEGTYPKSQWFDENRLETTSVKALVMPDPEDDGACGEAPTK